MFSPLFQSALNQGSFFAKLDIIQLGMSWIRNARAGLEDFLRKLALEWI